MNQDVSRGRWSAVIAWAILCLVSPIVPSVRADAPGERQFVASMEQLKLGSGLALVAGDRDGQLVREVAKALPQWIVLAVVDGVPAADALRTTLEPTGLLGRVVVQPAFTDSLPLLQRSAAIAVVDADALGECAPADKEVLRVLRPLGKAWVKRKQAWTAVDQPWPSTLGDCGHFHVDAGNSNATRDREVTAPRTIRWNTGCGNSMGKLGAGPEGVGVRIAKGIAVTTQNLADGRNARVAGFDAFSGLPLWRRDDLSCGDVRRAIALDGDRLVLWANPSGVPKDSVKAPAHLIALDARTGKDLVAYGHGPVLNKPVASGGWIPHVVLHRDLVIAAHGDTLWVLDAATGDLKWKQTFAGQYVGWPSAVGDQVMVSVGATGQCGTAEVFCQIETLAAFNLVTGREAWKWQPGKPKDPAKPVRMVMQVAADSKEVLVALQETDGTSQKKIIDWRTTRIGTSLLVRLDPLTGAEVWRTWYDPDGNRPVFRPIAVGQYVFNSVSMRHTLFELATGKQVLNPAGTPHWTTLATGCSPYRGAASGFAFRGLYTFRIEDLALKTGRAMAGYCQIGSFPANGMLYSGSTGCSCVQYIQGLSAFSGDAPPPDHAGQRLWTGPAKPAAPGDPRASAWRMSFKDAQRSSWTDEEPPAPVKDAWRTQVAAPLPEGLLGNTWAQGHPYAQRVTGPTLGDGLLCVAVPHEHRVLGLDPATGKERWSYRADARVDSAPTIASGLVVFGTRGGWVHALNRDTGVLVWKTLAAPAQQFRVQSGQVESSWPLHGTVAVHADKVYATAGFHSQHDGGFRWVELDLASGKELRAGRWSGESPWMKQPEKGGRWIKAEGKPAFISFDSQAYDNQTWESFMAAPEALLNPIVISPTRGWALMSAFGLDLTTGRDLRWGTDFLRTAASHHSGFPANPDFPDFPQPLDGGLLGVTTSGATYHGAKTSALAYRGGDYVGIFASDPSVGLFGGQRVLAARFRPQPPAGRPVTGSAVVWTSGRVLDTGGLGRAPNIAVLARSPHPTAVIKTGSQVLVADRNQVLRLAWADGKEVGAWAVPAPVTAAGLALADGRLVATCTDGSVMSWK